MLFIFDMGGVVTNTFTPQDLCNELKISVERVRQIENASLKKIKEYILKSNNTESKQLEVKKD